MTRAEPSVAAATRRRWVQRLADLGRRAVTAALIVSLTMLTPGAQRPAIAQSQSDSLEADVARIERFMALVRDLRGTIDRRQFDLDALASDLAFEEGETIAAWVRDHIAYEPYPGLLRGPRGTLMSRAGNALDQAVLLASLLNTVGYEARVAEGELDEAWAEALLRETSAPARDPQWAEPDRVAAVLQEMASLRPGDSGIDAALEALYAVAVAEVDETDEAFDAAEGFVEDLDLVMAALDDAGFTFDDDAMAARLVAETRTYHWTEYRLSANDPWQEAHPAFRSGHLVAPQATAVEVFASEIPERLQHRVRFQVFIEQRLGDELVTRPVTGPWEGSSANLHGAVQVFANTPTNIRSTNDLLDIDGILSGVEYFAPTLEGRLPDGGQYFDLEGNVVPPEAAANPAAGVVRSVGGAFGLAAGALDGRGEPEDFVALSAQWIEYTLIAPGGQERVARRVIVDRVGAANRALGVSDVANAMSDAEVSRALIGSHAFMISVGYLPAGYVLDEVLRTILATEPLVVDVSERVRFPERFPGPFADDVAVESSSLAHVMLYTLFDAASFGDDVRGFRSAPSVVVVEQGLTTLADGRSGIRFAVDIVANEKRFLQVSEASAPRPAPYAAVASGIWETHVERMLVDDADATPVSVRHVSASIAEARAAGIPLRLVRPDEIASLDAMRIDGESRMNLERDLHVGYATLVPAASPGASGSSGWWRIDPVTGETLGITGDGRGGVLTEYALVWANGFLVGFIACAILNMVLTQIVRAVQGEVFSAGKVITPQELYQCLAVGMSVGAFAGAVYTPSVVILVFPGGVVQTNVMVGAGWSMTQFKYAVSALNIGFGFIIAQFNQYVIPDNYDFLFPDR